MQEIRQNLGCPAPIYMEKTAIHSIGNLEQLLGDEEQAKLFQAMWTNSHPLPSFAMIIYSGQALDLISISGTKPLKI